MNVVLKEYDPQEFEFDKGDIIISTNGIKHLLIDFLENGENDYGDDAPDQIFKVLNLDTYEIKDYIKVILFEDDYPINRVLKDYDYKIVEIDIDLLKLLN